MKAMSTFALICASVVSAAMAAASAKRGVVIVKPKVVTKSMDAANAIEDFRKAEEKKAEVLDFAKNTLKSAPGARHAQYQEVLKAQGESVAKAQFAMGKSEEMMDDVAIEGDLPEKEQPDVPKGDDLIAEADSLADRMGSGALGCSCAKQLYGDASTTADTRVSLLSRAHNAEERDYLECNC